MRLIMSVADTGIIRIKQSYKTMHGQGAAATCYSPHG